jgi:predicted Zn-ribbon and HTH transcriptional regulator
MSKAVNTQQTPANAPEGWRTESQERSPLTIVAQQSPSLKPYIDALAGAMRRYTATEWTPQMKQMSDMLVTYDEGDQRGLGTGTPRILIWIAQETGKQPWGKDLAVNQAATDLAQAAEAELNKPSPVQANNERSPLTIVAEALVAASDMLVAAAEEVAALEPEVITADALDELAAVAESFDASDDELLRKQASVLDAVLEMFAVKKNAKEAEAEKIDQLKLKYKTPQEVDHKRNHIAEAVSDIEKSPMYKDRRVLSTPLSCRSCPDHASSAMSRVGENTYQCQLDKRVYNYDEGYTLLDGTKVAGSSVSGQTQNLWSNIGNPVFDTRDDRLGTSQE